MKIAVMQPYFYPYAGYYRLFAAVDLFVIFDDVQFPRRGRVHRCELTDNMSRKKWLTLPLQKDDRDTTRIMDLQWAEGAKIEWEKRQSKFPDALQIPFSLSHYNPLDFVVRTLRDTCKDLNLPFNIEYSRNVDVDMSTCRSGQDRILRICKHFGADTYINSPGGRDLYDKTDFENCGIKLEFLSKHEGSYKSILERIMKDGAQTVRKEIYDNL